MPEIIRITYALSELTGEANLAWCWLRANTEIIPRDPDDAREVPIAVAFLREFKQKWDYHVKTVGFGEARRQLNDGLEWLQERGIVENLKRDGHRDWGIVPGHTVLRYDKLRDDKNVIERTGPRDGLLVTGENQ